jgi:dihydrofolate reductase
MRELVLKMSTSFDGYVAGARAESDWMFRGSTPDSAAWTLDILRGAGLHLLGRGLFEFWESFWPTQTTPMAAPVNDIPKALFTHDPGYRPQLHPATEESASAASWRDARVLSGDLAETVGALKEEPGDGYILVNGGIEFARSLVREGLVDEFRVPVLPVALGAGESVFTDLREELDLELVSCTAFSGGALGIVYRPKR